MPRHDQPESHNTDSRRQAILTRLLQNGQLKTHDLAKEFSTTDVTVRQDFERIIEMLRPRGMYPQRVWGGLRLDQQVKLFQGFYEGQSEENIEAIEMLGEYVVRTFVHWNDALLLDAGRTVDQVARQIALQQKSGLRIITNSYAPNVMGLYVHGAIELVQLGGTPLPRAVCYVRSPGGDDFYRSYWGGPFKAILTGTGFHPDHGLMVNTTDIIEMKRRFIKASSEIVVILDHSKFERQALQTVSYCGLKPDEWLIDYATAGKRPSTQSSIPVTIVTNIPNGSRAEDLALSGRVTPQIDGRIALFRMEMPLTAEIDVAGTAS
jgi:DeoR/GlpR family transcriptional regulator of sugar metabolism